MNVLTRTAVLDAKGRITMPKAMRDRFGLETGDILVFVHVEGDTKMKVRVIDGSSTP